MARNFVKVLTAAIALGALISLGAQMAMARGGAGGDGGGGHGGGKHFSAGHVRAPTLEHHELAGLTSAERMPIG